MEKFKSPDIEICSRGRTRRTQADRTHLIQIRPVRRIVDLAVTVLDAVRLESLSPRFTYRANSMLQQWLYHPLGLLTTVISLAVEIT